MNNRYQWESIRANNISLLKMFEMKTVAQEYIDLIADAINGKQSTYSQGISLFGDKAVDIHLNNAHLYSLSEAQMEADKIFSKKE